jgi:segregation and condensation protein B
MTPDDALNAMTAMIADETEDERFPPPPEERDEASPADQAQSLRLLEAILFASADALDETALAARLPEGADIAGLVSTLEAAYAECGVNLVRVAGGWTFRTAPDLASLLRIERNLVRKLSRAAVETLAICAYHQPVTRAEIEEIRGVALSRGTLDTLFEAGWIRPVGRRRTPGRPVTWGTTGGFLSHFGLQSVADLPGIDELKAAGLLDTRPAASIVGVALPEPAEPEPEEPEAETGTAEAAEDSLLDPDETRE